MRRFGTVGAMVALLGAGGSIPARGQTPPALPTLTADQVVARVQTFYDHTADYDADFTQTYFHRLFQKTQRSYGHVYIKKPGKMRWEYTRPERKLFVSDAGTLWVYEPEAQQAFRQALSDSQLPTAISFLTGGGNLGRDFRSPRLLSSQREGFAEGYVLELRPRQPSPAFEHLLFYVEPTSFMVVRTLVTDAAGNRNRMDFTNVHLNPGIADARFRFTPPDGTRIIQPSTP
jgi:outer membrane lipoprotein carrier protein